MMLLSSKFGSKSTLSGEFMEEEHVELGQFQGRTADQKQAVQNATGARGGLSIVGRDYFGVFPLRGRLLTVREAKHDQIMKNEEIQNIKKIMGLQHNKDYSDVRSLQYGQLMIMTDQDHDGSHIKGLPINFLDHFFPSVEDSKLSGWIRTLLVST
ncbi:DNA topoisomerase [Lactarius hengduanensis]|nr:DNA topoisomerase [Lactarius hengduanensis]